MQNPKEIVNFQERLRARREEMMHLKTERIHVSDYVFNLLASRNLASRNPDHVTWKCPSCGIVYPKRCDQGYTRGQCKHSLDARYYARDMAWAGEERKRVEEHQLALAAQEAKTNNCYTWLGEGYSEYGLEELTFENFDAYTTELKAAYAKMLSYAKTLPKALIVHGPYGVGKTHLVCALLNYRRAHGLPGLFTTGANFFNALLACGDDMKARQQQIVSTYKTEVLAIDDPDHASATTFRHNTYKEVIGKRCSRSLTTIITTNIHIKRDAMELQAAIGGAAASRLNNGLVLLGIHAQDYRKRQIGG